VTSLLNRLNPNRRWVAWTLGSSLRSSCSLCAVRERIQGVAIVSNTETQTTISVRGARCSNVHAPPPLEGETVLDRAFRFHGRQTRCMGRRPNSLHRRAHGCGGLPIRVASVPFSLRSVHCRPRSDTVVMRKPLSSASALMVSRSPSFDPPSFDGFRPNSRLARQARGLRSRRGRKRPDAPRAECHSPRRNSCAVVVGRAASEILRGRS
jgi:hypothetical protein